MNIPQPIKIAVLALLLIPGTLYAEVVYVNDVLRVGVRPEPSNSVGPVNVVMTGMKLEVLERREGFIRIRSEQGVEGWIKEMYVSNEPPAQLQLADLQNKYQQLVNDYSKTNDEISKVKEENAALQQQLQKLKEQSLARDAELQQYREKTDTDSGVTIFVISGMLMIILFVIGLAAGIIWHRQQVTKRLGGLRF